ncbi:MAG TPA: hypothetical protein VFZ53_07195 [Polyangiaceae bacterium]
MARDLQFPVSVKAPILCTLLTLACARAEAGRDDTTPPAPTRSGSVTETDRKAEVTPELAERAQRILDEHADAPVGTEIPFTLGGKRYIGRIEEHADAEKGEHKGVTVYHAP